MSAGFNGSKGSLSTTGKLTNITTDGIFQLVFKITQLLLEAQPTKGDINVLAIVIFL